jgi:hypothetical protein
MTERVALEASERDIDTMRRYGYTDDDIKDMLALRRIDQIKKRPIVPNWRRAIITEAGAYIERAIVDGLQAREKLR